MATGRRNDMNAKEEILAANYWEHFKYAKELALMGSPKAKLIHKEAEKIRKQWNKAKQKKD